MPAQETRLRKEAPQKLTLSRENIMAYIKAGEQHERMSLGYKDDYSGGSRAANMALLLKEWNEKWEAASKE